VQEVMKIGELTKAIFQMKSWKIFYKGGKMKNDWYPTLWKKRNPREQKEKKDLTIIF